MQICCTLFTGSPPKLRIYASYNVSHNTMSNRSLYKPLSKSSIFSIYNPFQKALHITNTKPPPKMTNGRNNNHRRCRNCINNNRDDTDLAPIIIDDHTSNINITDEPIDYDTTRYCICENLEEYDFIVECVSLASDQCKNPYDPADWHAECAGWTILTTDTGPNGRKDIYIYKYECAYCMVFYWNERKGLNPVPATIETNITIPNTINSRIYNTDPNYPNIITNQARDWFSNTTTIYNTLTGKTRSKSDH